MPSPLARQSLLAWDQFTLRIDLHVLEGWLNREVLRDVEAIRNLRFSGDGEVIEVSGHAGIKGVLVNFSARLVELRVYHRFFGCRVETVSGPFGLPVPLQVLSAALSRVKDGAVSLDPVGRVLLVDLSQAIPAMVNLHIQSVRANGRWLELEVGPGSMEPPARQPAAPAEG